MKLKGINALITGGSQGLGKEIADAFPARRSERGPLRPLGKGFVRHAR
jgi:hypothetical protein